MSVKKLFLDIETDFGNAQSKRILSVGVTDNLGKIRQEWFIWQPLDKLNYPENVDVKYTKVLEVWKNAIYTPQEDVLIALKDLSKEYVLFGWNISRFDIPALALKMKKLGMEWTPDYFECCWALSDLIQGNKKMDNLPRTKTGKKSVAFEGVFKTITGMSGYNECHSALYDAEDERHIFKVLAAKYGKDYWSEDKIMTYAGI